MVVGDKSLIFSKKYAEYYDLFYHKDKDYEKESNFIESLFRKFARKKPLTILDLGCGTGNHSIVLAKRGYKLSGLDFSRYMINIANEKAKKLDLDINFQIQNIQSFEFNKTFDVIICMFATFGYITKDSDIILTLKQIKKHMHKDSLFIFEFWNGDLVIKNYDRCRVKSLERDGRRLIRISQTNLDKNKNIAQIDIECLVLDHTKAVDNFKETHYIRYFFFDEIKNHLNDLGFELLKLIPLHEIDKDVKKAWSIIGIFKLKKFM